MCAGSCSFGDPPDKDFLREAFGKGYIRVHAYTPADWSSIRRGSGTLFSELFGSSLVCSEARACGMQLDECLLAVARRIFPSGSFAQPSATSHAAGCRSLH